MVERRQEEPSSMRTPSPDPQAFDTSEITGSSLGDYTQLFAHLFNIGYMLMGQTQGVADRLCHEVTVGTLERAQLLLNQERSAQSTQVPFPLIAVSFPVQSRDRTYGTLCVAPDPLQPTSPALPLTIAHLLAQVCSWLLHTLELAALLEVQHQPADHQASSSLTKREREVLLLMCRGYDQRAIARMLSTSPATIRKHRQGIYKQLGVHTEREALLSAYQTGLFSPLKDIEPR